MLCAIWYHWYNLKNVKNTHRGELILVKLQPSVCNFSKIKTPPWVFLTFFILYEWYQIAQRTIYVYRIMWVQGNILSFKLMFDYHRIYNKNLMSGFSNFLRQEWIWLFKIPLNKVESCVRVEFSELSSYGRVIKTGDFGRPVLRVKSDSIGKISLLFKMSYKPFLSCSGIPLFLPEMGHIASSPSNPVLKMHNQTW